MVSGQPLCKPNNREKQTKQLIGIFGYIISDYKLTFPDG
jgi:hypothetical protein